MTAEEDKRQATKGIIIIPIMICILIIIFLIIVVFSKGKAIQPETQPVNEKNQEENQIETSPVQKLGVENKTADENQIDIEKIKMEIITGKREGVPPEMATSGEDKQLIIAEYLYSCYIKTEINERIKCYDVYYLSNDEAYRQRKENCEKLSGTEQAKCLDDLYYYASDQLSLNLCPAIQNETLMNACLRDIR